MAGDDSDEAFVKSVEAWIAAKRAWNRKADGPNTDRETSRRESERIDALFADMKAKFFGLGAAKSIQNRTN